MTSESRHHHVHDGGLTSAQASELMRLGRARARRPVDEVIDRLHRPDGARWLDDAIAMLVARMPEVPASAIVDGGLSVAQLTAMKEQSKQALGRSATAEERWCGTLGYFISIAAALRHHQLRIGGQGYDELDEVLLDLAEATPEPYQAMLCGAVNVLRQ